MSNANVEYVLNHNFEIASDKVDVCPNSIELTGMVVSQYEREQVRNQYNIPNDKRVFINKIVY